MVFSSCFRLLIELYYHAILERRSVDVLFDSACIGIAQTYSTKFKTAVNSNTPITTLQPYKVRYGQITCNTFQIYIFYKEHCFLFIT